MSDEFKPKGSLKSRIINLESQISELYHEIENRRVQTKNENQIIQNTALNGSVTYFAETTHSGLPHDHK